MAVSFFGSRAIRSRNFMSHFSLLKPARSPFIWCESPPVPTMTTFRSRSEEHTSELQSLTNLVCRLLLEKKKTIPFIKGEGIGVLIDTELQVMITSRRGQFV